MPSPILIAVTGPESTGKSELCAALAAHYGTVFVPEQSRVYLEQLNTKWQYEDVLQIARLQQAATDAALQANHKMVFCDTEMIAIKVWLKFYGLPCPQWVEDAIENAPFKHYLLMDIDLPWVGDVLRENPHNRETLFNSFLKELQHYRKPFTVVSDIEKKRLTNAIEALERLI
jgi:NadR type nicotinamide-nucleotide adenylyltransferase